MKETRIARNTLALLLLAIAAMAVNVAYAKKGAEKTQAAKIAQCNDGYERGQRNLLGADAHHQENPGFLREGA